MAAPVTSLPLVKLEAGLSTLTPEQKYWKSFKSQTLVHSPSNYPVTHISFPPHSNSSQQPVSEQFAVTSGTRVQIFSVKTRKLLKTISRFEDFAHCGEIRRDGRIVVAGDETGAIRAFDISSRAILKTWKEHKQPVWVTKFSPRETTTVLSASDDRTVRLWDLPSDQSVTTFTGHTDYVRSGGFFSGQASGLLVSGSYDQTVRVWDPRAPGSAVLNFKHANPVEQVLPMPSGNSILAAAGSEISVLDVVGGKVLKVLQQHQKTVTSLCLSSSDTQLVSGGLDGHVKMFDCSNWNIVAGSKYPSPVLSLSVIRSGLSREDRHIAVGMQSGVLSIRTRLSGQQKVKERERQKELSALMDGNIQQYDRKKAKDKSALRKRQRGRDFDEEGADIIIEGNLRQQRTKQKPWERDLRDGKYPSALDKVLETGDPRSVVTLLTALKHRSATKTALSGRDESALQPILTWVEKHIVDPRFVDLCVDVAVNILDLYAVYIDQSTVMYKQIRLLHRRVRKEFIRAKQAQQTNGMISILMAT